MVHYLSVLIESQTIYETRWAFPLWIFSGLSVIRTIQPLRRLPCGLAVLPVFVVVRGLYCCPYKGGGGPEQPKAELFLDDDPVVIRPEN